MGDYLTIADVLNPKGVPDWNKMTKDEILVKVSESQLTILHDQ